MRDTAMCILSTDSEPVICDGGCGLDGCPKETDATAGLPDDLARVLRDQSVVVSQDGAVFALIGKWANAPSNTASADLPEEKS